ncbi:MAG: CHRD domain-containing protein [Bacteroidota bacterium]
MIEAMHELRGHWAAMLGLLILAALPAFAQHSMSISLSGAAEVPPVSGTGAGTGLFTVKPDHSISGNIKVSGFSPSVAHIHEGAVGKNGPPIITLNKTASDNFDVPAATRLTDAQYASYQAGMLYVNVHSNQHPDGEIRGQLNSSTNTGPPTKPAY